MVIKLIRMRWAGHVAHIEGMRNVYKNIVRRPEGKRPLGRHGPRCKYSVKIDLTEIECEGMDWNQLAQIRARWRALVNTVMNLHVP
jgi:hypothetical protein